MTDIILLTGPSSSGKSTISRALSETLAGRTVWIEADRCFPHVASPESSSLAELSKAFHQSALSWPELGFLLVLDGSLPYEDRKARADCIAILRERDLLLVGVTASIQSLTARESSRLDRLGGRAAQQAPNIHDDLELDCIVDTAKQSIASCVHQICGCLT